MSRYALTLAVVGLLAFTASVQVSSASQLIDRNATDVQLLVDAKGEALITYRSAGQLKHVLAWGAENALPPSAGKTQVAFKLDYSGGYAKYHVNGYFEPTSAAHWVCLPYDGPKLALLVAACKAPDGSYWALQSWQRALPDLGVAPTTAQSASELHLSHWTELCRCFRSRPTGPMANTIISSGRSPTTERASTASSRPRRACRSIRSGATSTSIPSIRPMVPAGSGEQLPHSRPEGIVLLRVLRARAASRQGHAVSGDRRKARSRARRDVAGRPAPGPVRRDDRGGSTASCCSGRSATRTARWADLDWLAQVERQFCACCRDSRQLELAGRSRVGPGPAGDRNVRGSLERRAGCRS